MISCPSCGSCRIWKNGFKFGVQTFLCRDCSRRFSTPKQNLLVKLNVPSQIGESFNATSNIAHVKLRNSQLTVKKVLNDPSFPFCEDIGSHIDPCKATVGKDINALLSTIDNAKVCVPDKGAKNLVTVERQITALAQGTKLTEAELKGKIIEFIWWLKTQKENYTEKTIKNKAGMIRTLYNRGSNLYNPDSVILTIRMQKWSDGTKANSIQAYRSFTKCFNILAEDLPQYKHETKLPFIPLETEIDQLIAGSSKKVATFLQTLKETCCRAGEAWQLEWTHIDCEHNIITINNPEKHGLPRQIKVSSKLISMVQALPKTSKHVFGGHMLAHFRKNFTIQRRRVANTLKNPRIEQIHFHTLRHWGASMLYHKTKSILHVKERLGHRSIVSTMIYTHLVSFESDDFITRRTKDIDEAEELLKAGFDYVTDMEGYKLFRKRK